jgi:threonine dehydratase
LIQGKVYLKLENQQVTHSFKIRGVMNKLLNLTENEKARGIITASAGNHGQAVAFGAQKLGFSSKIVIPKKTPQVKADGIRQFGAELLLYVTHIPRQNGKLNKSPSMRNCSMCHHTTTS